MKSVIVTCVFVKDHLIHNRCGVNLSLWVWRSRWLLKVDICVQDEYKNAYSDWNAGFQWWTTDSSDFYYHVQLIWCSWWIQEIVQTCKLIHYKTMTCRWSFAYQPFAENLVICTLVCLSYCNGGFDIGRNSS